MRNRILSSNAGFFIQTGQVFYTGQNTGEYLTYAPLVQELGVSLDFSRNRPSIQTIGQRYPNVKTTLVPEAEFSFTKYTSDFVVESGLGLPVLASPEQKLRFGSTDMARSTGGYFNAYYVINDSEGYDFFDVIPAGNTTANLSGYTSLGLGNCQVTSYSFSASVGSVPTSSFSCRAANAVFENLNTGFIGLPSINMASGNNTNYASGEVHKQSFVGLTGHDAINRSGITLNISGGNAPTMSAGGTYVTGSSACIQSLNISVDYSRKSHYGFGSDYVRSRTLTNPSRGSVSMSILVSDFEEGGLSGLLDPSTNTSSLSLNALEFNFVTSQNLTGVIQVVTDTLNVDSVSYGASINGELTADINLSFYT